MSRFFIDRPIFAWVIALVVMLFGVISISRLPVSRYPNIAPPVIFINAQYPGASAKTVEELEHLVGGAGPGRRAVQRTTLYQPVTTPAPPP